MFIKNSFAVYESVFILSITFHLQTDPNVPKTPKRIIKVNDIYVKVSDIYI